MKRTTVLTGVIVLLAVLCALVFYFKSDLTQTDFNLPTIRLTPEVVPISERHEVTSISGRIKDQQINSIGAEYRAKKQTRDTLDLYNQKMCSDIYGKDNWEIDDGKCKAKTKDVTACSTNYRECKEICEEDGKEDRRYCRDECAEDYDLNTTSYTNCMTDCNDDYDDDYDDCRDDCKDDYDDCRD